MRLFLLIFACLTVTSAFGQSQPPFDLSEIAGTWVIDLRPTPESEAYLKDFVIKPEAGTSFSGTFYDTNFKEGQFNLVWDRIYFAFATRDRSNYYFHSGYFADGQVHGISYSPDRAFTMPWKGSKKDK